MLPGMIHVIASVISPGIVSNPRAVVVDVRSFGVAFAVAVGVGRGSGGRAADRGWTMSRNVSSAHGVAASSTVTVLRKSGKRDDEEYNQN
jgi:hypothetical protein